MRIGTVEYSRLTITPIANSNSYEVNENISSRIGNLVRISNDSIRDFNTLELSYPALKGASGAPVLDMESGDGIKVFGLIISNVDYELMPVQTLEYRAEDLSLIHISEPTRQEASRMPSSA